MNRNWNKYHENLLKKWAQMSKTYSIMHSLCARHYATWHKRLGIPVVIIGGATASSIFSSNKEDSEVWTYINGSLTLIVSALAGLSSFLGTSEKTIKHQNASFKYTKISMDIDALLSFGRNERSSTPQEFIHEKKMEMLEIRENVPEILPWIMNEYLKRFDKSLTNIKSSVNNKNNIAGERIFLNNNHSILYKERTQSHSPITDDSNKTVNTNDYLISTSHEDIEKGGGQILPEFEDKLSSKVHMASEQMRKAHSESDSESGEN